MSVVVGIDGCRGGWVIVRMRGGAVIDVAVVADFAAVLAVCADADVVAVDVPIGLLPSGVRDADRAARAALKGRASCVFEIPPRSVVESTTYAQASVVARALGKGVTQQAFNLFPKILEVDWHKDDGRVFEVHPEICFLEAAGKPLPPKKTWAGAMKRRALLAQLDMRLPDDFAGADTAGVDDVFDAAIAAWTAERIQRKAARSLPGTRTQRDGIREIAIWV